MHFKSNWQLATGCWLLAAGYWLLVAGISLNRGNIDNEFINSDCIKQVLFRN
jgi:hypothetical protein